MHGITVLCISGGISQDNTLGYLPDPVLNEKVSLWEGDITRLEVDAIVNSSADDLHHHFAPQSVCSAIHAAAGPLLSKECYKLNIDYGDALVTRGYNLPAKCKYAMLHNILDTRD